MNRTSSTFFVGFLLVAVSALGQSVVTRPASDFPAGTGSILDTTRNAFGYPLVGATTLERREFFVGNSFFKSAWVAAPSSTEGRDGLGPTYNANSCSSCHPLDGRGIGFRGEPAQVDFSLLIRLSLVTKDKFFVHHPVYGEQLNPFGIAPVPGEGQVNVKFEDLPVTYPDGSVLHLRRPRFEFSNMAFGDFEIGTRISPRVGTQLIGLGLIENIDEADLLRLADPDDLDGDGISGRANYVMDIATQTPRIGRFGWKASQPSIRQQTAAAFNGDLGLTSSLFPAENCPAPQLLCRQAPSGGQPEVNEKVLDRVTTYTQLLSVPMRRHSQDPTVLLGERIFNDLHCQKCHQAQFRTSTRSPYGVLNAQLIFPYSDFLLHDMGMELADHRPDGKANGREWRTQPLWGVGLIPVVNGHQNLLHDARARNVEEAILWHGGEGEVSKQKFKQLSRDERDAVIKFVNSL